MKKLLLPFVALALAASAAPIASAQTALSSLRTVDAQAPEPTDSNARLASAFMQAAKAEAMLDMPSPGETFDYLQATTDIGLENELNRWLRDHPGTVPTRIRLKVDQRPVFQSAVSVIAEPSVVITGYRAIVFYPKPAAARKK